MNWSTSESLRAVLANLPGGWRVARLGREAWVRARLGWKGLTADEYVDDGYLFLSTPNIKSKDIDFEGANFITEERFLESPEIILAKGDVLLTKDGATIGIVNLVRDLPSPATVNGSIAVITPSERLHGGYLNYVLQSDYAQSLMRFLQGGMGVPHLFQRDINRMELPLPPIDEQHEIADFLDREVARIDEMIDAQRELASRFQERRRALVDTALLSLDAKWGHLSHVATLQTGITLGGRALPGAVEYPYLRVANVQSWGVDLSEVKTINVVETDARRSMLRKGDVLMTEGGDRAALGRGCVWNGEIDPCLHQNHIFAIRPDERLVPEYLVYVLESRIARTYFESTRRQTTNLSATNSTLVRQFRLPLPSPSEQERIVAELNGATARVATMAEAANAATALMQERRSALISATVMGRVDPNSGREFIAADGLESA